MVNARRGATHVLALAHSGAPTGMRMQSTSRAQTDRDPLPAGRLALSGWLPVLLAYTLAPLVIVVTWARPPRVDFWWDAAMALGAVGAGGFALLPLVSPRWWVPEQRGAAFLRHLHELHRTLSYGLILLILVHGIGLIVLEPRTLDYLFPSAPVYMLSGISSAILVVVLTLTSLYRHGLGYTHAGWRRWHAILSAGAVAALGWHLVGSGYYYGSAGKFIGLAVLVAAPTVATLVLRRRHPAHPHAGPREGRHGPHKRTPDHAALAVWIVLAVWIAAAALYAATTPAPRAHAECDTAGSPCP